MELVTNLSSSPSYGFNGRVNLWKSHISKRAQKINVSFCSNTWSSGLNATDKTPLYEMPLNFVVGGLGRAFFVLRLRTMAFCHWDPFAAINARTCSHMPELSTALHVISLWYDDSLMADRLTIHVFQTSLLLRVRQYGTKHTFDYFEHLMRHTVHSLLDFL